MTGFYGVVLISDENFSLWSGSFFPVKSFIAKSTGPIQKRVYCITWPSFTYFPSKFLWMSVKNFPTDLSPTEFWSTGLTSVEKSSLCIWEDPQLNLVEKEKLSKLTRANLERSENTMKERYQILAFGFCGSSILETDRLCNHWLNKTLRKKQWFFWTITVFTTTLTRLVMKIKQ